MRCQRRGRGERCGRSNDGATHAKCQRLPATHTHAHAQAAHHAAAGRDDGAAAATANRCNGGQQLRALCIDLVVGDRRIRRITGQRRSRRHGRCLQADVHRKVRNMHKNHSAGNFALGNKYCMPASYSRCYFGSGIQQFASVTRLKH